MIAESWWHRTASLYVVFHDYKSPVSHIESTSIVTFMPSRGLRGGDYTMFPSRTLFIYSIAAKLQDRERALFASIKLPKTTLCIVSNFTRYQSTMDHPSYFEVLFWMVEVWPRLSVYKQKDFLWTSSMTDHPSDIHNKRYTPQWVMCMTISAPT